MPAEGSNCMKIQEHTSSPLHFDLLPRAGVFTATRPPLSSADPPTQIFFWFPKQRGDTRHSAGKDTNASQIWRPGVFIYLGFSKISKGEGASPRPCPGGSRQNRESGTIRFRVVRTLRVSERSPLRCNPHSSPHPSHPPLLLCVLSMMPIGCLSGARCKPRKGI